MAVDRDIQLAESDLLVSETSEQYTLSTDSQRKVRHI